MASIKDVAKRAGVSSTTVSFVLNGRSKEMRISPEVTERILAAAREIGYTPNKLAVALRTGRTRMIGLMVEDISNQFFSHLARQVEDEAKQYGYQVVYCSTENNPDKAVELIESLQRQRVDGYLIAPCVGMEESVQQLIRNKMPIVLIDRLLEGISCPNVVVNNYEGLMDGVRHLVKHGYSRIGFINVDLNLSQIQDRERGFLDGLKAAACNWKQKTVLRIPYKATRNQAAEMIQEFIQRRKPDALIFGTNYLGLAGLEAIKKTGLKIPTEIAVMCFDDNELFSIFTPSITAIRQPVDKIAQTAVKMLMRELGETKGEKEESCTVPVKIIPREST